MCLSPLHAVSDLNAYSSGRRGWGGVQVHIGPHSAERVGRAPPRGGVGRGGFPVDFRGDRDRESFELYDPFSKGQGQHNPFDKGQGQYNQWLKNKKCEYEPR